MDGQYYLAPLGEVLRGMLPLMAEVKRTVYYRITDLGRDVLAGSLDGDGAGGRPGPARRGKFSREELDLQFRVLQRLASGEPVKVSTLRTATSAGLAVLASAAQKVDCARDLRCGARCPADGAICRAGSGGAAFRR